MNPQVLGADALPSWTSGEQACGHDTVPDPARRGGELDRASLCPVYAPPLPGAVPATRTVSCTRIRAI